MREKKVAVLWVLAAGVVVGIWALNFWVMVKLAKVVMG